MALADVRWVNTSDVCNALYTLGRLAEAMDFEQVQELRDSGLVDALAAAAYCLMPLVPRWEIGSMLYSLSLLQYRPPALLHMFELRLLELSEEKFLSSRQVATVSASFAALKFIPFEALRDSLAVQAKVMARGMSAEDVAYVLWAFARWQHIPREAMWFLCIRLRDVAPGIAPKYVGLALWALARMQRPDMPGGPYYEPHLMPKALREALQAIEKHADLAAFGAAELSNTLWGMSQLGYHPCAAFLESAAAHLWRQLEEYGPNELGRTLFAFATLQHSPGKLVLHGAGVQIQRRLQDFMAHNVASVLHAFATLGHQPQEELLGGLVRVLERWQADQPALVEAKSLAFALAALARLKFPLPRGLLATWGVACLPGLHELSNQAFISLLWAVPRWTYTSPYPEAEDPFLEGVAAEATVRMHKLDDPQLRTALIAFAKLRWNPSTKFLDCVKSRIEKNRSAFPEDCTWCFTVLGYER